jgi:hypothetical protein
VGKQKMEQLPARGERAASSSLVLSLIRQTNETKTRMQSEAGVLGEAIKSAAENGHLHPGALKFIARLARMDELKRNDFRRALALYDDYAVAGGLFSGGQHDLIDRAQERSDAHLDA